VAALTLKRRLSDQLTASARTLVTPDGIAVAVLVLLPFVLLAPAFWPGHVLSPTENLMTLFPWKALAPNATPPNHDLFDPTHYFHPALLYASEEIRAGRFPFWNPYQYTGAPFFSNPQTATLFPLTALAYVLPVPLALALAAALKLAVAGVAMFWFLRVVGTGPVPAIIGALGFMLGSQMIGWLQWTFSSAIMLIPALFAAVEQLRARATAGRTAALAILVGLELLAGYPQGSFHALVATAAWTLARAPGAARGFAVRSAAAAALGCGIAAVQLVPFVDYVRESAVYAYRAGWTAPLHVPIQSAVTFVMPLFYGAGPERWSVWQLGQFAVMTTFVGLVPIVALPCGVLHAVQSPVARFFVAMVVVAGGVHYGGPLLGALAGAPGMSLGTNARLMPWLAFGICTLAALGLEHGPARWARLLRGWFAIVVLVVLSCVVVSLEHRAARGMTWSLTEQYLIGLALLAAGAVTSIGWLTRRTATWGVALAACQLASLVPLALTYNPVRDAGGFYPTPTAIAWLQQHRDGRAVLPGQLGSVYRIPLAQGYDGMTPRRIDEVVGPVGTGNAVVAGFLENPLTLWGSEPLSAVAVLRSGIANLLGVRYVVLPPGADLGWPDVRVVYDGADARIFERPGAWPRAFLVGQARCVREAEAIQLVRTGAIDFRREVILADCATPPPGREPASGDGVEIVATAGDRVRLRVSATGPAYVVVTDTWFPGWRATVDGTEATLWRANHAFRAVWVPGGRHDVELRFRPRGFHAALAVTLAALAGVATLGLLSLRRPAAE
jgi:hypothetical protein